MTQWSLGHLRFIEQGTRPITTAYANALAEALHLIRPLSDRERVLLKAVGTSPETLEILVPPPAPPSSRLAALPTATTDTLVALLELLGPDRFALWAQSSLASARAVASTAGPIPRLTSEEVDPVTGSRWKVSVADPAFVKPRQQSPEQGDSAPKRRRKQS